MRIRATISWLAVIVSVLIVSMLFYYFFALSRVAAVGTVTKKMEDSITVSFEDGVIQTIRVPSDMQHLVKEGGKYFVVYHQNVLRKPFIIKLDELQKS
ncbi:hypothetical protein GK047_01920 [Paenibacillus sp. SYP-B3998]|uniref:Uncharacterized protein n=1 Tax=Paenibacillus sp. SYP-B3998 TaxID=2678564 RepID=A0A6G3ZRE1_9BACL|nr:hypothetical protein [Paenibacillus sp. SYP-B3998]NEW04776.1 hypothetical protein [Paenibacillus sp. SYP-B3998]